MADTAGVCVFVQIANLSECASWVQAWAGVAQALGALLALAITIGLWRHDHGSQQRDAIAAVRAIANCLADAMGQLKHFADTQQPEQMRRQAALFDAIVRLSAGVRLDSLPASIGGHYLALVGLAEESAELVKRWIGQVNINGPHMVGELVKLESRIEAISEALDGRWRTP